MGKSSVDMERLSDSIVCARGFTVEKAIDVAWLHAQVDRTCSSTISKFGQLFCFSSIIGRLTSVFQVTEQLPP